MSFRSRAVSIIGMSASQADVGETARIDRGDICRLETRGTAVQHAVAADALHDHERHGRSMYFHIPLP